MNCLTSCLPKMTSSRSTRSTRSKARPRDMEHLQAASSGKPAPPSTTTAASTSTTTPARCHLLELPLEIQLMIYAEAVTSPRALLLNCPCNSSYRGRLVALMRDEAAWAAGDLTAPPQPALTRTCRAVRQLALPLFYRDNVFRACYCYPDRMLAGPTAWLRAMGPANRAALRHLYFYDRNFHHDRSRNDLETLMKSDIFGELGGEMTTLSSRQCCAHLVTFGPHKRREGEVPIAAQADIYRLMVDGEV